MVSRRYAMKGPGAPGRCSNANSASSSGQVGAAINVRPIRRLTIEDGLNLHVSPSLTNLANALGSPYWPVATQRAA